MKTAEGNTPPPWRKNLSKTRNSCNIRNSNDTRFPPIIINSSSMVFSVALFVLLAAQQCMASSNVSDAQALLAFRSGLDPYSKIRYAGWSLDINVCDWTSSIKCNNNSRVESIYLSVKLIKGVIVPEFGNLDQVTYLDLSQNALIGGIPAELGNMISLRSLILSDNQLSGAIPPELGNLSNLTKLNLNHNFLTGELPPAMGNLSSLQSLYLRDNYFTGIIPDTFGQLSKLKVLDMGSTNSSNFADFSGTIPASFSNLTKLKTLHINNVNLEGSIPPGLLTLSSLQSLILSNNKLSGPLPPEVASFQGYELLLNGNNFTGGFPTVVNMPNIQFIDLSYNPLGVSLPLSFLALNSTLLGLKLDYCSLVGPIPDEFASVFNPPPPGGPGIGNDDGGIFDYDLFITYTISLSGNYLNGTIPESFGNITVPLLELILSENQLTGEIPESFQNLAPYFVSLDLHSNLLSGKIPDIFEVASGLTNLDLSANNFSGSIPPSLGLMSLCSLRELNLTMNSLSGKIPPELFTCDQLTTVGLSNNSLSGRIPPTYSDSCGLAELDLSHNLLEGQIPKGLSKCDLQAVDFSHNNLYGPIPSFFFSSKNLTSMILTNNSFNGSIPQGNATTGLAFLDLSENKLEGSIPSSLLLASSNLGSLNLSSNLLSNSIPSEIGNLSVLQFLDLSDNQLNGSLPSSLASLSLLSILQLGDNNFSGPLPPLTSFSFLSTLDLTHNSLSGALPDWLASLKNLRILDLSFNAFSSSIPSALGNISLLRVLDLSSNNLSGSIPLQLASLSNLMVFNVSNNSLTGVIPGGNLTRFNSSSFLGTFLCGYPLSDCVYPSSGLSTGAIIGIAAGCAGAIVILVIILGVVLCLWRKEEEEEDGEFILFQTMKSRLNMRIIRESTDNFSEKKQLGAGGFGAVYKVTLEDGTELAVKRLHDHSSQGLVEIRTEMETLGRLKHRHLVVLVGSFVGKNEALLIYEFLPGGDLDDALYHAKRRLRDWPKRHSALLDAAKGIKYLHHEAPTSVIHRDIKPANVLFDREGVAKVADFGLAREIDLDTHTHLSTTVAGTVGYLAGEYVTTGKLNVKSDVFAFGVMILQVLTGRRPGDESLGDLGLARWTHKALKESGVREVADPFMSMHSDEEEQIVGALRLGLMCTSKVPTTRPTMEEVVYVLENLDIFDSDNRSEAWASSTVSVTAVAGHPASVSGTFNVSASHSQASIPSQTNIPTPR